MDILNSIENALERRLAKTLGRSSIPLLFDGSYPPDPFADHRYDELLNNTSAPQEPPSTVDVGEASIRIIREEA